MSPVLYTLYTNDLTTIEQTHKVIKYADDTAIVGFFDGKQESLDRFTHEETHFIQLCDDNYLKVYVNKTKEMVFDFRKKKSSVMPVVIKDECVETVSVYKYLGVEIDNQLKFYTCTKSKYSKLQQRLFFLRKLNSFYVDKTILQ